MVPWSLLLLGTLPVPVLPFRRRSAPPWYIVQFVHFLHVSLYVHFLHVRKSLQLAFQGFPYVQKLNRSYVHFLHGEINFHWSPDPCPSPQTGVPYIYREQADPAAYSLHWDSLSNDCSL